MGGRAVAALTYISQNHLLPRAWLSGDVALLEFCDGAPALTT